MVRLSWVVVVEALARPRETVNSTVKSLKNRKAGFWKCYGHPRSEHVNEIARFLIRGIHC